MVRKLLRIGNSVGITLDKKVLRILNMDGDTWVTIEPDIKHKRIIVKKRSEKDW